MLNGLLCLLKLHTRPILSYATAMTDLNKSAIENINNNNDLFVIRVNKNRIALTNYNE